jgi:hypothetical protein
MLNSCGYYISVIAQVLCPAHTFVPAMLLLPIVKIKKVWMWDVLQWHTIHMKFCQTPSSSSEGATGEWLHRWTGVTIPICRVDVVKRISWVMLTKLKVRK